MRLPFILVILFLLTACAKAELPINQPAPDFTLQDAQGKTYPLSDYRGKIVVLEWINPECPFVVRHYEAKTMTTLANQYADKEVVWLAVDSSHFVTPGQSKTWQKKHQIPYPILQDPSGKVGRLYEAKTTPHLFVIDPQGVLVYEGAIDDDVWGNKKKPQNYIDSALKELLAGKNPTLSRTKPYGCSVKYK